MNSSILNVIVFPLVGLLVALYVMVGVLTGEGNTVGQAALYGMIGCLLVGMLSPRGGVFLMIFLAAYSDLVKRLLILETQISMLDVTYVLGMAPMALAGSVLGVISKKILRMDFEKRDFMTFGAATLLLLLGAAMGFAAGGEGLRALRIVADYGAFSYLMFVVPILFPTRDQLVKLMKYSLIVFAPVAAYGIWQRVFGLADFEMAYLLTGLSTESRQLDDTSVRPFSTLNAASSLTMVAAACVMLCVICWKAGRLSWVAAAILIPFFALSCFMTFTRVGWAVLVVSVALIPVMRSRIATAGMYVFGIVGFVVLVWQSDSIRPHLHDWQDEIYGRTTSDDEMQGLRIVTLSDRLIGFENMKLRENWQPFGIKHQGADIVGLDRNRYSTTFSHDAVSGFLFQFGYVPMGIGVLMGLLAVTALHRAVFRLPDDRQRFAQLGLAGAFGALLSLATGGTVFQFPANIFFWMLFCLVLVSVWEGNAVKRDRARQEAADRAGAELPAVPGRFPGGLPSA
jgi:hypothetical protein